MNRPLIVGIVTILFIFSIVGGMFSIASTSTAEGFSSSDLRAPLPYTADPLPDIPQIVGSIQTTPDVIISISLGRIFEEYGGAIRLIVYNNDTLPIFLIDVGFDWMGTLVETIQAVHSELLPGEHAEIRAMAVDPPPFSGNQHYRVKVKILEERAQGWFRVRSGGSDWLMFSQHAISVTPLIPASSYEVVVNYLTYYDKANELVDFQSLTVEMATNTATAGLGPSYNIGKACAIFDYVDSTIVYTDDPGEDLWYSPDQCLLNRAGDCEDYSLLISTMIHQAGGTARIYLTEGHAFAAVYAGNSTNALTLAADGIRSYYGGDVKLHAFADETGYWLFADPLGSFYLGGTAVGAIPSGDMETSTNFTFEDTTTVYAIDITGEVAPYSIWMNTPFWLALVILFGLIDLGAIIWMAAEKEGSRCRVCERPTTDKAYKCDCGVDYHHTCLPSEGFCIQCNSPIENLPPLPPINVGPRY
jgi:hypothetical protein